MTSLWLHRICTAPVLALSVALFSTHAQAGRVYVNDNTPAGDVYTSAVGNDANAGTSAYPFLTINHAITIAGIGDTVYVDAGVYSEQVAITKSLLLFGTNAAISPNTGTRIAESTLDNATGNAIIVTTTSPVIIKGFRITTSYANSINVNATDTRITLANTFFDGSKGVYFNAPDSLFIIDNRFSNIDSTSTDALFVTGDYKGTSGSFLQAYNNTFTAAHMSGMNVNNVQGSIYNNTFSNIAYYGILVAGHCGLAITNNTFSSIANPNTSVTGTWGAGLRFYSPVAGSSATVAGNYFINNYNGISVCNGGNLTGTSINVYNNYFSGNTLAHIINEGTGSVKTSCNWYGATDSALIAAHIIGDVAWRTILSNGFDTEAAISGFQPSNFICAQPVVSVRPSIHILSFSAKEERGLATLRWQATSERDLDIYIIERSEDGVAFYSIGYKVPQNRAATSSYTFIDPNSVPGCFYRLRMEGVGGLSAYSGVQVFTYHPGRQLYLYPNPTPAGDVLYVRSTDSIISWKLSNGLGKVILFNYNHDNSELRIPTQNLSPGLYMLQAQLSDETRSYKVFIK